MSIYMNIRDLIGEATEYDKKLELDVTQDVTQDVNSNDLDTQIIYLIKKDDKISTEQMSKILEVSTRTIKRHIKEMIILSILAVDIVGLGDTMIINDNSIIFHIDVILPI